MSVTDVSLHPEVRPEVLVLVRMQRTSSKPRSSRPVRFRLSGA